MRHIEGILEEVRRSYNSPQGPGGEGRGLPRAEGPDLRGRARDAAPAPEGADGRPSAPRGARSASARRAATRSRATIECVTDAITAAGRPRQLHGARACGVDKRLYPARPREGDPRRHRSAWSARRIAELGPHDRGRAAREQRAARKLGRADADAGKRREALDELSRAAGETERNIAGFTADIEGFARAGERQRRGIARQRRGDPRPREPQRAPAARAARHHRGHRHPARPAPEGDRATPRRSGGASRHPWRRRSSTCASSSAGRAALLEDASGEAVSPPMRDRVLVQHPRGAEGALEQPRSARGTARGLPGATLPRSSTSSSHPRASSPASARSTGGSTRSLDGHRAAPPAERELRKENLGLRENIDEYRKTLEALRINLARLQTQHISVEQEIARLAREKRRAREAARRGGPAEVEEPASGSPRPTRGSRPSRRSARDRAAGKSEQSALAGLEFEISTAQPRPGRDGARS